MRYKVNSNLNNIAYNSRYFFVHPAGLSVAIESEIPKLSSERTKYLNVNFHILSSIMNGKKNNKKL